MSTPKREVKIIAKLKLTIAGSWDLILKDRTQVIRNCVGLFVNDQDTEILLTGTIKKVQKTSSAKRGYFFAEIIPRMTQGLLDAGWHGMTDDIAYKWLCKRFNGTKTVYNERTNEIWEDEIITFSDLDDQQASIFINQVITFGNTELNVRFQSPEEHKQQQANFDNNC